MLHRIGGISVKKILVAIVFIAWAFILFDATARNPRGGATGGSGGALILPAFNNVQSDWQNAGLPSGIPTRATQCGSTVAITGLIPPQTNDDTDKINAALSACTAGQFVKLAASTNSTATVSISGITMTCSVCTGIAIGVGVAGTNIQPGTTVTAGSGTSWTISFGPNIGTTVSSQSVRIYTQYLLSTTKNIAITTGVSLRGADACASQTIPPFCGSVLTVYNGALPDWSISNTQNNAQCGITTASFAGCSVATGAILMSPSANYDWGWAGCNFGNPGGYNAQSNSCGTTLTADAAQGATSITVTSTSNFSVGMDVLIDESPAVVSTTDPTGGPALLASPEFLNASTGGAGAVAILEGGDIPGAYSFISNGGSTQQNQRLNSEVHKIASIVGSTITFDDPLTLAFRISGSHDARLYWPSHQTTTTANPFTVQAGVENLTLFRVANGGVDATFCEQCWVKNVEVGGWIAGSVNHVYTLRNQIEFSYFHDCFDCENNGTEYPIGISQAATESLVINNIIVRGGKCMVGRASTAAVVAYNYGDDTFYMAESIGDYWNDMCGNGSHYAGTHHWLFEGNQFDNCDNDETHGSASYHVFFRNHCMGSRTPFLDPSNGKTVNDYTGSCWGNQAIAETCGVRRAAGPMAFNYRNAFLSNVLGLSGITTTGNGWVYKGAYCGGSSCPGGVASDKAIWFSGWVGSEEISTDPNLTTNTNPWIFRNGNYDYVNASIVDNASGYSQSFPNSLYLSAKPGFFSTGTCTYPWPQVTPTSSPFIQANSCSGSGLPARARADANTPFVQP